MPHWRLALGLLAVAACALGSHALMVHFADRPWAVAVLLGPLLLMALWVAWRKRHLPGLALVGLLAAAVMAVVARGGVGDVNRLYLIQHAGIHLALGASFGLTLRPGRRSMITVLALRVHEQLTPDMQAYTRNVTRTWAIYFFAMAALSLAVFATLSFDTWSLLANVGTPLAIAALFVGEHVLRYRLHPEFERAGLVDGLRAYRRSAPNEAAGP